MYRKTLRKVDVDSRSGWNRVEIKRKGRRRE